MQLWDYARQSQYRLPTLDLPNQREQAAVWGGAVFVVRRAGLDEALRPSSEVGASGRLPEQAGHSDEAAGEGVIDAICEYDWPCGEAVSVAICESHLDPDAVSPDGANLGVFQVNVVHGYHLDLADNIAAAYGIWSDSGGNWSAWSCEP